MKFESFLAFLSRFWQLLSDQDYPEIVVLLKANPNWVERAVQYRWADAVQDLGSSVTAHETGQVREAASNMQLILASYKVGYHDGVDSCFEVTT